MVQTVCLTCLRNRVILDQLGNKEYRSGHEAHDHHTVCYIQYVGGTSSTVLLAYLCIKWLDN